MQYIVSGSRRTGTSMMMKALFYGFDGVNLVVNKNMEQANFTYQGYSPNPGGLWEVGQMFYFDSKWIRQLPDNCLVKILYDGLPTLPRGNYKIIFMERDEDEILSSIERVEAAQKKNFEKSGDNLAETKALEEDVYRMLPYFSLRPYNRQDIDDVLGICKMRRDFDLITVDYGDVISNPLGAFTRLKEWGLPIDPKRSARIVTPKLYRVRKPCPQQSQECEAQPQPSR